MIFNSVTIFGPCTILCRLNNWEQAQVESYKIHVWMNSNMNCWFVQGLVTRRKCKDAQGQLLVSQTGKKVILLLSWKGDRGHLVSQVLLMLTLLLCAKFTKFLHPNWQGHHGVQRVVFPPHLLALFGNHCRALQLEEKFPTENLGRLIAAQ